MKKSKQCPKCDSLRVGYLENMPDKIGCQREPRFAGTAQKHDHRWHERSYSFVGELEGYVCTDCGYVETYVKSPETVKFADLDGFVWLNAEPDPRGPFR